MTQQIFCDSPIGADPPDIIFDQGPGVERIPPPSILTTSTSVCAGVVRDDPFIDHEPQTLPNFSFDPPAAAEEILRTHSPVTSSSEDPSLYLTPQATGEQNELPEMGPLHYRSNAGSPLGYRPFRPAAMRLQAEIEEIRATFVFCVDDDGYHLSIPRIFVLNLAYGFIIGAFSFLGLRALSYSPLAALIGSFPLALALLLVNGILA